MADLSGYTALTEAHGAMAAADIVDRYVDMVKCCLVGESYLHERIGDEVLIISSSPEDLLSTALVLLQTAHKEENFLLLHGGLHWGKLLQRNNSYFGTAINLAARIASKADRGSIWCSQHFIASLSKPSSVSFTGKGKHQFKNIDGENELYQIEVKDQSELHIDPVCHMLILDEKKAFSHPSFPETYFCSPGCMDLFVNKNISLPL